MLKNKYTIVAFKILISSIILVFIFKKIDINAIYLVIIKIRQLKLLLILLAIITFCLLLIMTFKWKIFLNKYIKIKFWKLFLINWAANFADLLRMGGVGGELFKTVSFTKKKTALVTSLVDKIFSLIWTICFGLCFFISYLYFKNILWLFVIVAICAYYILSTCIILLMKFKKKFLLKAIGNKKIKNIIIEFPDEIGLLLNHSNLNLILNIVYYAKFFLIFKTLNIPMPYLEMFIFLPVLKIALILPISIQGIGVREFMYIQLAYFAKSLPEKFIAVSFISYSFGLLFRLPSIVPFLMVKK